MGLILKYVVITKAGTRHYRRRFPRAVAGVIGKGEFKRLLGETEREALRNYPRVHGEFERLVAEVRERKRAKGPRVVTPLDIHAAAVARAAELASSVVHVGGRALSGADPEAADILRESYLSGLPIDPETGEPVGGDAVEGRALGILASADGLSPPAPTIEDARKLYLKEKVAGRINERAKTNRINRAIDHLDAASVKRRRILSGLTREDARKVRDYLLRDLGMNPATVRRNLNDIRAVINLGLREFDLRDTPNPFLNLPIELNGPAILDRSPFPDDLLPAVRERIEHHASPALWHIWRIVENTGCRLGEVSGLLVSDLDLDHKFPHASLVHHPHRRLKNAGSVRKVPLIGEALKAAKEARKAAGDSPFLFPLYGRERGSDAASAALMKHVRGVTDNPKVVVHSLRHRMEDKMILAGVSDYDRNLVLGHSSGGMGDKYGGLDARMEAMAHALKAALSGPRKRGGKGR